MDHEIYLQVLSPYFEMDTLKVVSYLLLNNCKCCNGCYQISSGLQSTKILVESIIILRLLNWECIPMVVVKRNYLVYIYTTTKDCILRRDPYPTNVYIDEL